MTLEAVAKAGRIRAYWPLNEADGPGLEAYNGLDGADATGVGSDVGLIYPLAREFLAANSDHLVVPDNTLLDMPSSGKLTIAGWYYPYTVPATAYSCVAKWALPNGIVYLQQLLGGGPTGSFRNLLGNAAGDDAVIGATDSDVLVSANSWYFVISVIDETTPQNTINVNQVFGPNTNGNPAAWTLVDDGSDLWIGSDEATGNDFDGRIQGVVLIDGTLTGAEISEMYGGGSGFDLLRYAPKKAGGRYGYYY